MRNLFIATSLMSAFAGFSSRRWWVGLAAFLWLGGMNWLISVVRHGFFATEISGDIDDMLFGKEEVVKSEELKNWM